ncbi:MAG: HAD family hydrolase [Alphaproteobacteria bacterium]|nr:MAG: HAD family hydrolase [Alphaproteobacteria bacterium]
MHIRGVLFDKDGTLLDFAATWEPVNRIAALAAAGGDVALSERLLAAGGYDPASGRFAAGDVLAAGNTLEIAAVWQRYLPGRRLDELAALIDRIFQEQGRRHAVPVPELVPTLQHLKTRGLKLGIATSDSRQGVEATLGAFGVLDLFDFLAGYDSGHGVKPEPGMVHAFCEAVGLRVSEIAVVGDTFHDLEMGRAAGAGLVVGVLTGTGERAALAPHADVVVDSIADLPALLDGTC